MIYKCDHCDYTTKDSSNYSKHKKTKRHNKNVIKSKTKNIHNTATTLSQYTKVDKFRFYCEFCKVNFSRLDSLTRHSHTCLKKRQEELQLKNKELSWKMNFLKKEKKKEMKHLTKEVKHYKEEAKYYKYLFEEAGGIVKKSISSGAYIKQNYVDAPYIRPLTIKDLKGLEQDKKKLANNIMYTYRHDIIDKYIGDEIIAVCLSDDPYRQFIWNTDASRFTYMIRDVVNKVSIWQVDKGGRKTAKYLIDPIMKEIKELMIEYYKTECQIKDGDDVDRCVKLTEDSHTILNIIENINDKIINNKILKYITPPLMFRRNLIK
jgi:hypothetical protein